MPNASLVFERILYAIFPKRCVLCTQVITPEKDACANCLKDLPRVLPPVCIKCGRGKSECLCRNYRFYYSGLTAPFYYEGVIGKSIRNFKFRGKTGHADFFAKEMTVAVKNQFAGKNFDLITCVPLTKNSYKIRGFNQSFLLAKAIGGALNIEISGDLIVKIYDTPAQHTMTSSMRRGNLAGVFDVARPDVVKGKMILLCDDVATTGSTINECAKMLLLYGAKEVCCVTAAVTRKVK